MSTIKKRLELEKIRRLIFETISESVISSFEKPEGSGRTFTGELQSAPAPSRRVQEKPGPKYQNINYPEVFEEELESFEKAVKIQVLRRSFEFFLKQQGLGSWMNTGSKVFEEKWRNSNYSLESVFNELASLPFSESVKVNVPINLVLMSILNSVETLDLKIKKLRGSSSTSSADLDVGPASKKFYINAEWENEVITETDEDGEISEKVSNNFSKILDAYTPFLEDQANKYLGDVSNVRDTALSEKNLRNAYTFRDWIERDVIKGQSTDDTANWGQSMFYSVISGGIFDIEEDSKMFTGGKNSELNKDLYKSWTYSDYILFVVAMFNIFDENSSNNDSVEKAVSKSRKAIFSTMGKIILYGIVIDLIVRGISVTDEAIRESKMLSSIEGALDIAMIVTRGVLSQERVIKKILITKGQPDKCDALVKEITDEVFRSINAGLNIEKEYSSLMTISPKKGVSPVRSIVSSIDSKDPTRTDALSLLAGREYEGIGDDIAQFAKSGLEHTIKDFVASIITPVTSGTDNLNIIHSFIDACFKDVFKAVNLGEIMPIRNDVYRLWDLKFEDMGIDIKKRNNNNFKILKPRKKK